ncbi:MAG: HEPN domain-containing protein [Elusimicrobia bacterium]|nr:HEPN domain-containing protein [Elusimicrobiota bacterium]
MSPKKRGVRPVGESEARSYLKKAEDFYLTMTESFQNARWNSVGLAGVHCAISATDAVLGLKARLRSAGESHHEAVELLRQHVQDSNTAAQAQRLSRILGAKNRVEYDSRDFRRDEAADMVKDVGRYLEWVKSFFPL